MGYHKELMMQEDDAVIDHKIAEHLGISYDDLISQTYDIEEDLSKDDFLYNYRVEFDVVNSDPAVLKKIKNLVNGKTVYLQPWDLDEDVYEDYFNEEELEAIVHNENHIAKFENEISNLRALLTIDTKNIETNNTLKRHIFIGVISTLETFLSEVFIKHTLDSEIYLKRFIKTHPAFKTQKFKLEDIYEKFEKVEDIAKKVMLETIYHNMPVVNKMYSETFEINFPKIDEIQKFVMQRHDLVHRNGQTKKGEEVKVNEGTILNLIENATHFMTSITTELKIKT